MSMATAVSTSFRGYGTSPHHWDFCIGRKLHRRNYDRLVDSPVEIGSTFQENDFGQSGGATFA